MSKSDALILFFSVFPLAKFLWTSSGFSLKGDKAACDLLGVWPWVDGWGEQQIIKSLKSN